MLRAVLVTLCACTLAASSLQDGRFDFNLMRFFPSSQDRKRSLFVDSPVGEPTNEWVFQLSAGADPRQIAQELGLEFVGNVGNLPDTHVFRLPRNRPIMDERLVVFHEKIEWAERQFKLKATKTVGYNNEPNWNNQWHFQNTGQNGGSLGADSHIVPVWQRNNFGQDSQIAIVDDGFETAHPDLAPGYVAADSYDFVDNNADPNPALATDEHGVACAGVVGARDEGSCGVGAAYRARLAGIRLISAPVLYSTVATAETYRNAFNQIYSNSWTFSACYNSTYCTLVDLPATIQNGFISGTTSGRGGKGSIFLFSAGNSRDINSNTNYQAMQRSIYVIVVSASTNRNGIASYSEPGSGVHVAAPSNGGTLGIFTADRTGSLGYSANSCTSSFGGTSSACPLVAGIVGLMLTANPNLTWRDVQYILAKTAAKVSPGAGWQTNGAGFNVSHDFGFGVVDANAAVSMAETYTSYLTCASQYQSPVAVVNLPIPDNNVNGVTSTITVSGVTAPSSIEHTLITVTISHSYRGQLRITLRSPAGTQSFLALPRSDPNPNYSWTFKSNFNWGENPNGLWSLTVSDEVGGITGTLQQWFVSFSGPCAPPATTGVAATTRQATTAAATTGIATTAAATTRQATTAAATTGIATTAAATTRQATTAAATTASTTRQATTAAATTGSPATSGLPTESTDTLSGTDSSQQQDTESTQRPRSDQFALSSEGGVLSESSNSKFGVLGNSFTSWQWIVVYIGVAVLLSLLVIVVICFVKARQPKKFTESWYL